MIIVVIDNIFNTIQFGQKLFKGLLKFLLIFAVFFFFREQSDRLHDSILIHL